jgi:plasmid maintenance system antidote protein VapI
MNEGKYACLRPFVRASDVRGDYEELKLSVDRLAAVLHHQQKEIERLINRDSSIKPDVALVWRAGHDLVEQGVTELNAVRQRMGLRIQEVVVAVQAYEMRQPILE